MLHSNFKNDKEPALSLCSKRKTDAEEVASKPAMFLESYVLFGGTVLAPSRLYAGEDGPLAHVLQVDNAYEEESVSLLAWERVFVPSRERFIKQETLNSFV